MPMKLILPIPPSANDLTFNLSTGGRANTKEYIAWIKEAGWEVQIQRRGQQDFKGFVTIATALSETAGIDLDNANKATIDLLVRHQIIPDDNKKYVRRIVNDWQSEDDKLHVTVEPIEQQEAA